MFVIDGLDECNDPQKQALIVHVASILRDHNLPICFLIASRPELAISSAFQQERRLHEMFASIALGDDDDDTHSDIRQFIEDSFLDILDCHPFRYHIILPWPDPPSVDYLASQSSRHVIYASTAMKFIAASDEHPPRTLAVVEGLHPSRKRSPFAQLDALYLHRSAASFSSPAVI